MGPAGSQPRSGGGSGSSSVHDQPGFKIMGLKPSPELVAIAMGGCGLGCL